MAFERGAPKAVDQARRLWRTLVGAQRHDVRHPYSVKRRLTLRGSCHTCDSARHTSRIAS